MSVQPQFSQPPKRRRRSVRASIVVAGIAIVLFVLWMIGGPKAAFRREQDASTRRGAEPDTALDGARARRAHGDHRANDDGQAAIESGAELWVNVKYDDGRPCEGAEVFLLARSGQSRARAELFQPPTHRTGTTDTRGRVSISVPRTRSTHLVARDADGRISNIGVGIVGGAEPTLVIGGGRTVRVTVVSDEHGRAIDGADVHLRAFEPSHASWTERTTTDEHGVARFPQVPKLRSAILTIRHPGFAIQRLDLDADALSREIQVRLTAGRTFELTVQDEHGRPTDVRIWWKLLVRRGAGFDPFYLPLSSGTLEARDGNAVIRGIPRYSGLLVLARHAETSAADRFECEKETAGLLRLASDAVVRGRATIEGTPAANIEMPFWPTGETSPLRILAADHADLRRLVLTDEQGRYEIRNVPCSGRDRPEPYTFLLAEARDGRRFEIRPPRVVNVRSAEVSEMDLRLDELRQTTITGVVTNREKRPVADALISQGVGSSTTRSSHAGRYEIDVPAVGSQTLICRAPGFAVAQAEVRMDAKGPHRHDFTLRTVAPLRGSVVSSDGQPMPNVLVRVFDDDGVRRDERFTNANGEFLFAELEPGRHAVECHVGARLATGHAVPRAEVWLPADAAMTIRVPVRETLAIEVAVEHWAGAEQSPEIGGLQLLGLDKNQALQISSRRNGRIHTFDAVPPGNYMLSCQLEVSGTQARYVIGPFSARADNRRWTVSLPAPGRIEGVLLDRERRGVPSALVEVVEAGSARRIALFPPLRTDSRGQFTLDVGPGRYIVRAWKRDIAAISTAVRVRNGATADVELLGVVSGSVEISVPISPDANARTVYGEIVLVGRTRIRRGNRFRVRDGEVRVNLDGLVPGPYRARVEFSGIGTWERDIVVEPGKKAAVRCAR